MFTKQRTIAWFLMLIVMAPGLASATRKGRLIGRVVDPEGSPIEGVAVTATAVEISEFRELRVTNKKGVFKIDFEEINVTYHYRFEKTGFKVLEADQYWSLEGSKRHDFAMVPGETPTAGDAVATSASQPAVLAYNDGLHAYEARDFATAQTKFEEAIGHDPELRQAWAALSVVHLAQEHYQEAVEAAEEAMALGSTDETLLRSRWEAYRNLGDEDKTAAALRDLERFGRLTEEAKRIYNEAVVLAKAGDQEGAFAKFKEASEIDPTLQAALLGLATAALKIDRGMEAAAAAESVLEDDPQNARALRLRYNAALQLGGEDMIIDSLVGLAAFEFELVRDTLWNLALAAYDANDLVQAKERFTTVLEVDPDNARSHYYLALIYVNEGANEETKRHLERFLELAPDDPDAATARDLLTYLSES